MRLILARHGETEHNATGFVQGQADVPLNELGRRQAATLASALAGERPAAIVSSPLARARETAAAIAGRHRLSLTIEPALMEMNVGAMEGLSGPEMRARFPDFMRAWVTDEGPYLPMPDGESLQQVQDRAWPVVDQLLREYGDATVVAVTHNFVLSTLVCRALGAPLTAFRRFRHGVAANTVIELSADRVLIRRLNDDCHLERAGLLSAGPWARPGR